MQPGEPTRRDLERLYAICADADAELGSLAAELDSGQLRSLVTDALGKLSALQWYAVRRLGRIPGDDEEDETFGEQQYRSPKTYSPNGDARTGSDGIDWDALWALAVSGNGAQNGAI